MKKSVRTAIAVTIILTGIGLTVYPLISNYFYETAQEDLIKAYDDNTENIYQEERQQEVQRAREYNRTLQNSDVMLTDPFDPEALMKKDTSYLYSDLLNIGNDGIMGYLEIPAIDLSLNLYHGTGVRALESGVGHLENTSLPVGGESTHAVLSAHSGLPGKKLFTDLELLEKGDIFLIHILDEVLAYQVDRIKVVDPEDTSALQIQRDKDYVTLVTCTPYGINSHRLLVRGERVPYEEVREAAEEVEKRAGSQWMRQYFKGIFIGIAIFIMLLVLYRVYQKHKEKEK